KMNDYKHTVLCVDDEENIQRSLKRLFRKENFRFLKAETGEEGLKILQENPVHLVISDNRMPIMSGIEFLARVRENYPDMIRMVLTGFTDLDTIMESVNLGHIFKFVLKPWNDQNLIMDVRQALQQYDLIQANKQLHERILEQNLELKKMNGNLEDMVQKRTKELEIQNQALELSRAILTDLPLPIMGISPDGMIVLINNEAQSLSIEGEDIQIGKNLIDYFSADIKEIIKITLQNGLPQMLTGHQLAEKIYNIDFIPLSGRFTDKGIILVFQPAGT
ncbi:MAG: response regulator, partial [Deltaproteobacteria bacterium]|nr:response regulator [Deltaproteobacteria bacterium]